MKEFRFVILGAGNIAGKFCEAVSLIEGAAVVAVASKSLTKAMNFAEIQEQGFIALYKREAITDDLHEACGFRTDYQFITKSRMKTIQKKSKRKE